ncbi:hypothetical protein COS86_00535 [Candidatus Bathyarchaeota archaeon CG07_land_8_20_14_0_80_47_9]|nr:MAG: hypothetical protein COS86_00535 [Candidatus Bathyarchaeota archaeon CG07_land_8_20_14_0_80_47_9]
MTNEIEKKILEKMLYEHYIGGKHTSADNIPKGLPKARERQREKSVEESYPKRLHHPKNHQLWFGSFARSEENQGNTRNHAGTLISSFVSIKEPRKKTPCYRKRGS